VSRTYALAVRVYTYARENYRRYSMKNRPPHVAEAYERAKRILDTARGAPRCPSPHLHTDLAVCAKCPAPCYRGRLATGPQGSGN
jgi:hypothetical protein